MYGASGGNRGMYTSGGNFTNPHLPEPVRSQLDLNQAWRLHKGVDGRQLLIRTVGNVARCYDLLAKGEDVTESVGGATTVWQWACADPRVGNGEELLKKAQSG